MTATHLVSDSVPVLICVSTVKECVNNLNQEDDKEKLVSSLWGAERCLRVLESVSDPTGVEMNVPCFLHVIFNMTQTRGGDGGCPRISAQTLKKRNMLEA